MTIDDLRPGDVLLFSPEAHSWESEAIVLLTGAPVSHAAIAVGGGDLIEATPPAVRQAAAAARFPGRKITVRRASGAPSPMDPVVAAARGYLQDAEPYPMANLYFVAMLLLYRRLSPATPVRRAMLKVFRRLTASLMRALDEREFPGKKPMVCSQFVFQCFEDAGGPYALTIRDGLLLRARARTRDAAATPGPATLLRRVLAQPPAASLTGSPPDAAGEETGEETSEELARELVEALRSEDAGAHAAATTSPPEPELTGAIRSFAAAVHRASEPAASGDPTHGLTLLAAQEACFVTPADLLLHCPSLEDVGEIAIPAPLPEKVPA